MYTIELPESDRLDAYGVLDIETDGLNGRVNELVAIGVGSFDGSVPPDVAVFTRADARNREAVLIESAFEWLEQRTPEGLVTYNGAEFDLPFLRAKVDSLDIETPPGLGGRHVDLFTERKRQAELAGRKWPRLEECLDAYSLPVAETDWDGDPLTNARFGEELAPRYLSALDGLEFDDARELEEYIREYASTDVQATIALYEADAGRWYVPPYVGRP